MQKIESYEQIRQFMSYIRSLKKGFVTNFYWDDNKHHYWINEGLFHFEQLSGCFLLLHENDSCHNLFDMAIDYAAVNGALQKLNLEKDVVVDIVCKGDGSGEREAFQALGFEDYRCLFRMVHIGQMASSDWDVDENVNFGCKFDAHEINAIFQHDFDPLCEQLPSLREIEDYIERKQLLVFKDGERLCGFLIFEITGVTWYLRYWYTSPKYRNQGVGAKLLKTALVKGKDTKRQLFWVISDNENAIKRYEHYGFRREDMNDYVMIKHK